MMKPKHPAETVQAAVLTIFIGSLQTFQAEMVPREDVWDLFRQRREISMRKCRAGEGTIIGSSFPFMQVLFSHNRRYKKGYIQTAVHIAGEINRAELDRKIDASTFGISAGTVSCAVLKTKRTGETAALGFPVSLSRKLAHEPHRCGYPLLLDASAGSKISGAAVIAEYRIPGREEIHTLYGYDFQEREPESGEDRPAGPGDEIRAYKINEIF